MKSEKGKVDPDSEVTPRHIVYVPREGFRPEEARQLLSLPVYQFLALKRELVYGEWVMWEHQERITLAGMRALASEAVGPLEFRRGRGKLKLKKERGKGRSWG